MTVRAKIKRSWTKSNKVHFSVCLREGDLADLLFSVAQLWTVECVAKGMSLYDEKTLEDYERSITVSVKSSQLSKFASVLRYAGVTRLGTLESGDARALKLGRSLGFAAPL